MSINLITFCAVSRSMIGALSDGIIATSASPEASYLVWIDATDAVARRAAGGAEPTPAAAEHLLAHGVGLSAGQDFGTTAGYARLNLACTRATLERGLERICEARGEPASE